MCGNDAPDGAETHDECDEVHAGRMDAEKCVVCGEHGTEGDETWCDGCIALGGGAVFLGYPGGPQNG